MMPTDLEFNLFPILNERRLKNLESQHFQNYCSSNTKNPLFMRVIWWMKSKCSNGSRPSSLWICPIKLKKSPQSHCPRSSIIKITWLFSFVSKSFNNNKNNKNNNKSDNKLSHTISSFHSEQITLSSGAHRVAERTFSPWVIGAARKRERHTWHMINISRGDTFFSSPSPRSFSFHPRPTLLCFNYFREQNVTTHKGASEKPRFSHRVTLSRMLHLSLLSQQSIFISNAHCFLFQPQEENTIVHCSPLSLVLQTLTNARSVTKLSCTWKK